MDRELGKPFVDSRSRELADYFLSETICTEADRRELARDIQDAVEAWFLEWERKKVPASRSVAR